MDWISSEPQPVPTPGRAGERAIQVGLAFTFGEMDEPGSPAATTPPWAYGVVELARMDDIVLPRHRARLPSEPRRLAPLVASLRTPGRPFPPLPARRVDGRFELIEGARLLEAARILEWTHVPLLVVDVDMIGAVRWTILGNCHSRRYLRWEKVRAIRYLLAVGGHSTPGRTLAAWTGWHQSDVSECRKACEMLTPKVLLLAGVDEDRDADRLVRLTREDVRAICEGSTEAEVADRMRTVLNGDVLGDPDGNSDGQDAAEQIVTSVLAADGRWNAEVQLAGISGAQIRKARKQLLAEFEVACRRMLRGTAETDAAPPGSLPVSGSISPA